MPHICKLLPRDLTAINSTAWEAARRHSEIRGMESDPNGLAKINLQMNLFCEMTCPHGRFLHNSPVSEKNQLEAVL